MTGKAIILGNDIDTDLILPGEYLSVTDEAELGRLCMEGYEKDFSRKIQPGDVFVAGTNFGGGSSREHAPTSIRAAGVRCVIAKSFARIFYRNAINIGLPILESKEAAEAIREGDSIEIRFESGEIINRTTGETYTTKPFPEYILSVIRAGGMIGFMRKEETDAGTGTV